MTTIPPLLWESLKTSFGYRYRAVIPQPTWEGLLGQSHLPVCVFSAKEGSVYIGSGIHRFFSPADMAALSTTEPLFLSMLYESLEAPSGILPKHMVCITGRSVTLDLYADAPMTDASCEILYQSLFGNQSDPKVCLANQTDTPTSDAWVATVLTAQKEIAAGALEKIVLSRKSSFKRVLGQDGCSLYTGFAAQLTHNGYHYFYRNAEYTLMGHSPEALLRVRGSEVAVDVVAGTRLSGCKKSLLNSSKDLAEHGIVLDYVQNILAHYGAIQKTPRVEMDLGVLTHLYQCVKASVPKKLLGNLIQDLHPTPAICGFPKQNANLLIADLEQTSRGWYGGIFGLSIGDTMDLAVAIRGLLLTDTTCVAQVGAGIVAASDPVQEWQELNTKLHSVVSQLGDLEILLQDMSIEKPSDAK